MIIFYGHINWIRQLPSGTSLTFFVNIFGDYTRLVGACWVPTDTFIYAFNTSRCRPQFFTHLHRRMVSPMMMRLHTWHDLHNNNLVVVPFIAPAANTAVDDALNTDKVAVSTAGTRTGVVVGGVVNLHMRWYGFLHAESRHMVWLAGGLGGWVCGGRSNVV